jgi:AraC-like DNA-binding protein
MRMLMDGFDASDAAYEVGYESVSQFSREYSKFFGLPNPRCQDAEERQYSFGKSRL